MHGFCFGLTDDAIKVVDESCETEEGRGGFTGGVSDTNDILSVYHFGVFGSGLEGFSGISTG